MSESRLAWDDDSDEDLGSASPVSAADLAALPKAHLHLHFTGSLRHHTMVELAAKHGVSLPDALTKEWPPLLRDPSERGWFRFQRLYDAARAVVRDSDDIARLMREAALDDRAEGSRWLEIQVDPTSYAPRLGGLTAAVECILDCARAAEQASGVGVAVIIAANRTRHPLEARTLARLATQYAHGGSGHDWGHGVVGFGLSNDERRGVTAEFERAFTIARRADLLAAPHGGELLGPSSVHTCLNTLGARRVGHGVRSVEDPALLERLACENITLEVCPSSNVSLGVYDNPEDVPLRTLYEAGIPLALGADDPLLFGTRLLRQYVLARHVHGLSDTQLADIAQQSLRGSCAPDWLKNQAKIDTIFWQESSSTPGL